MKQKLKKIILWKPKDWQIALGAVFLLILMLIPLLRLAVYAMPWYDDYMFGRLVKNFLNVEYSLKSALEGAFECARTEWYAWQGCFSCSFFNSLVPIVWREDLYWLGPMYLIVLLTVSVFVFVKGLVRNVLAVDRWSGIILPCAVTITVVMLIHTAQAGFYWYVGGTAYVAMHSFFLLLAAGWVRLLTKPGKVLCGCLVCGTAVAAVIVSGANYVTGLQGILLGISLCFLGILLRKKQVWFLLPSLLIYSYGFYKSFSAPGNAVRAGKLGFSGVGGAMSPMRAVGQSFVEAFAHIGEFTGVITVVIIITLVPVILRALKGTTFSFRYPGLILLWSFCFYATGFTPTLYAMGHGGFGRTLNVVKITYQLLLFLNVVYWLGWGVRKRRQRAVSNKRSETDAPLLFYLAMGAVMLLIFHMESNQAGSYSAYGAYYYVHTGEANELHKEYLSRIETIKAGGDIVTVTPYHFRPWFLSMGELSDNPDYEPNRAIADWYGKQGVICVTEEQRQ